METEALAQYIARLTLEKKADDVRIMDLRKLTTMTDYFVICSGDSEVQTKAINDHIHEELRKEKIKIYHTDDKSFEWIVLDLVDIVVHIFKPEVRQFYALEKLWGDAKVVDLKNEN